MVAQGARIGAAAVGVRTASPSPLGAWSAASLLHGLRALRCITLLLALLLASAHV
jgi:hypothetical protein